VTGKEPVPLRRLRRGNAHVLVAAIRHCDTLFDSTGAKTQDSRLKTQDSRLITMSLYLGFDCSTQGFKALLVDVDAGKIIASESVVYGRDLPQFLCPSGFLEQSDPLVKHAPPQMWLAALDLLLERLHAAGAPLADVCGISGSGQQHGSAYFNSSWPSAVANLDPSKPLAVQLGHVFSRPTSPIWMDSSTTRECEEISRTIGPRLQSATGSPAIERFTGPQIRKFWRDDPQGYESTFRIHLVSSFLCSVLIGGDAAIDYGDGAGMNLLDLHALRWDEQILAATAPGLGSRLPGVEPSHRIAGGLHAYFRRYGLVEGTPVLVWSGDNPNSLVGVGAGTPGTAVISLGTSDVFFAAMPGMRTDPAGFGHVFGNPAGGFMSLIAFKNGSLARENVRDSCGVDWEFFGSRAFEDSPPGNHGNLMLPYFVPEITPLVLRPGVKFQGEEDYCAGLASSAVKVRAVVESQALSMRLHSRWIGAHFETVRVTGGASRSRGLVQTLADVFQARVELIAVPESAALGAALRAAQAVGGYSWEALSRGFAAPVDVVEPRRSLASLYDQRLSTYERFETEYLQSLAG
jgi:xylulokinase